MATTTKPWKVRKSHFLHLTELILKDDWVAVRAYLDEFAGSYAAKLLLTVMSKLPAGL